MNVTMVACYGDKPLPLARFIETAQSRLRASLPSFAPYDIRQVHGTIIGLEGSRLPESDGVVNANYLALRGERRRMDLARIVDLVRRSPQLPLRIQIGGFLTGARPPFLSRGQHPYERSFSITDERAVAMGWPHVGGTYPASLARLRRDLESVGVLHKYHAAVDATDDDFFFVLGRVRQGDASEDALRSVTDELRASMGRAPIEVVIDSHDIHVVGYIDPALPRETSVAYRLLSLDPASTIALYPVGK
jgi:hypothetical protein